MGFKGGSGQALLQCKTGITEFKQAQTRSLPLCATLSAGFLPRFQMKFQLDEPLGGNSISRHDARGVWVNGQPHTASVLVPWRGEVVAWAPSRFEELGAAHFEVIGTLKPELVIFGSGAKLRFPSPALWRSLVEARIGFEVMDLAAACRTYNVLASEGRNVLAALLIEG